MDAIAGRIAFPSEVIKPFLEEERRRSKRLTFAGIEHLRQCVCPEASFQATLNASVARWPKPMLLIEAGMGWKNAERDMIEGSQLALIPRSAPKQKLRVLAAVSNDAARKARFRLDRNMAVPSGSIVSSSFAELQSGAPAAIDTSREEDLAIWRHSNGTPVGFGIVHVEVRLGGSRVVALLQR